MLVDKMAEQDGTPMLYLSHSCDPQKNPLNYEKKLYWCDKAFGDRVNVVESEARNMYQAAQEIYSRGFTNLIYLCGSDRADEAQNMSRYNGKPDKKGNIIFDFDSIEFVTVGNNRINEDDLPLEQVSASQQRKFVAEGDIESFKKYCPDTLTEEEREELFYDVKAGMGINESYLYESKSDLSRIGNILKNNLPNDIINKCNIKPLSVDRHPKEIMRIAPIISDDPLPEEELISGLSDSASMISGNIGGKDIESVSVDKNDFTSHEGASREHPSLPVNIRFEDGSTETYYITINGNRAKKELVWGKVSDSDIIPPSGRMAYDEVSSYIKYSNKEIENILKTLVEEVSLSRNIEYSKNLSGNLDYLRGIGKNAGSVGVLAYVPNTSVLINNLKEDNPSLYNKIIGSIDVDFAEVVGAVALSSAINKLNGTNLTIMFPSGATEPLIDYTLYQDGKEEYPIRVSAKTGAGGKPSGSTFLSNAKKSSPKIVSEFIDWINGCHYNKSKDNSSSLGFRNLANKTYEILMGIESSAWARLLDPAVSKIGNRVKIARLYYGDHTQSSISELAYECNEAIRSLSGSLIVMNKFKSEHNEKYWDNAAYAIMSKLFASILNYNNGDDVSQDYLINKINKAFSDSYGVFIQNYCKPSLKSGLSKGIINFEAVFVSMDGETLAGGLPAPKYEFVMNTGQNGENGELSNQKLAISLRH